MTPHDTSQQNNAQSELQWWIRVGAFVATGAAGAALLLWFVLWQILPRYAPEFVMEYSPFVEPALNVVYHNYPYFDIFEVEDRFGDSTCDKYLYKFLTHENEGLRLVALDFIAYGIIDDDRTIQALYRSFEQYQDVDILGAILLLRHKTLDYLSSHILRTADRELLLDAHDVFYRDEFLPDCVDDEDRDSVEKHKSDLINAYDLRYLEFNLQLFLSMPTNLLEDANWSLDSEILSLAQHAEKHDLKKCQQLIQKYSRDVWRQLRLQGEMENYWDLVVTLFRFDQNFLMATLRDDEELCDWLVYFVLEEFEGLHGDPQAIDALIKMLETKICSGEATIDPAEFVDALYVVYPYRGTALLDYSRLSDVCRHADDDLQEGMAILAVDFCMPFALNLMWDLRAEPNLLGAILRVFQPEKELHMYAAQREELIKRLPEFAWRLYKAPNEPVHVRDAAVEILYELYKRNLVEMGMPEFKMLFEGLEEDCSPERIEYLGQIVRRQQGDIAYISPLARNAFEKIYGLGKKELLRRILVLVNERSSLPATKGSK